ncbi:MAG: CHAT domain-containing protein [Burkholderiaceae bacterium]|nr:CHAT domain-containing protein [Burkholderiaceae bacterium]
MSEFPDADHLLSLYQARPDAPLPLPADPTPLFDQTKNAIVAALNASDVARADAYVAMAWALARQTDDPACTAWAHWCAGLALLYREPRAALQHLGEARDFYHQAGRAEEEGRVLIGYAGLLGQMGRLDEAAAALERSITALAARPDYSGWPVVYLNLSDVQGRRGDYAAMLQSAQQAERLAERFGQPHNRARACINQAVALLFLGEWDAAAEALTQALAVARETGCAEVEGRALLNLARLAGYRGHLFAALRHLAGARVAFAAAQIEIDQATADIEEAALYERLAMPYEARRAALAAADLFAQAGLPAESVEARLLAVRLSLALEQPSAAREQLQTIAATPGEIAPLFRDLALAYSAHPLLHPTAPQRRAALAQAEAAAARLRTAGAVLESLAAALIAADLAAALRLPDRTGRYRAIMEAAGQAALPALEQQAAEGLARVLRPHAAIVPLRRAADLVAEACRRMPVEELKARLLGGYAPLYARLIEAQLSAGQPEAAARTLLEAKGGLWADLAAPPAPVPADPAWLRARTELDYWREEARWAEDADYAAHCRARVEAAEQALAQAARLQGRPRASQPLPEPEAVRAALPEGVALADYLVTEERIWACVWTRAALHWLPLAPTVSVRETLGRVGLLLAGLSRVPTPEERRYAAGAQWPLLVPLLRRLYGRLLAPLIELVPSGGCLLLSPDGFLYEAPWAVLSDEAQVAVELILLPSAAVTALPCPASPPAGPPLALGYAGDPPLLAVEAELAQVQAAMPDCRCILPARTRDLAWGMPPRRLHIAAHGRLNRRAPLLSRLALADGDLLWAEALHLPLWGTELVTLSACESGVLPERGGVLLALAGAFLCAGAQATLASLWAVDDTATQILMGALYAALEGGASLSTALRQAQAVVREAGYAHPYYWAAFQGIVRDWGL